VRRHRRTAISLLALAAALVAAVIALAGGSSGSSSSSRASGAHVASTHHPATHDRATPATDANASVGAPGQQPVPILIYHVIAAAPPGAPFPGLYVEPAQFAEQMQALANAGWHAVTLDQVQAYWSKGAALPPGKPIVVSFDNGYNSQYAQALPVLRRLGWVGDENLQLTGLPPSQGGLSERQIRGLIAAGWELDTQGNSHADLITLDAEQLRYQIADTRQTLRQRYQVPVNWFCYPSGHYDPTVIAAVKAAGFTGSTTVVDGWAHPSEDPYRMHRIRVLRGTSGQELLELLASTHDDPPAPSSYSA